MDPVKPPNARQVKAAQTRRRMLAAAYDQFCEHGYRATTMDAIAEQAGVAVQTLYFTFHTKGAILGEVLGAAVIGFHLWVPPREPVDAAAPETLGMFHGWFASFQAEPDARRALATFVDAGVDILERTAPLVAAMQAAAGDPEAPAVLRLGEQRRAETFGALCSILAKKGPAKKGGLRRGVTVARATDIFLTIFSDQTYQSLTARGWSPAACRRWFVEVLTHQLLAPR